MNEKKYLDYDGLYTLVSAFKDLFPLKTDVPEAVPTVVAGTHASNFDMLTATPGYYVSTNSTDFYYNVQGEYHTNRPVPFFTILKNIQDAAYNETFGYGLYFENSNSLSGYFGLIKFDKYNNTYINVTYIPLGTGVSTGSQYWYGVKTFTSLPKLNSYIAPVNNTDLVPKGYVDEQDVVLLNNLAPAYDSTATYSVGDYVTYNNLLYVCNTTISTAEAWTAAHWTQTTVMAEIKDSIGSINATLATLATPSSNGGGN